MKAELSVILFKVEIFILADIISSIFSFTSASSSTLHQSLRDSRLLVKDGKLSLEELLEIMLAPPLTDLH